jgi:hypothetical protein
MKSNKNRKRIFYFKTANGPKLRRGPGAQLERALARLWRMVHAWGTHHGAAGAGSRAANRQDLHRQPRHGMAQAPDKESGATAHPSGTSMRWWISPACCSDTRWLRWTRNADDISGSFSGVGGCS